MSVSSSPRVVGDVRSATVNQDRGGIEHQKAFLGKPSFGRIGLDPLPPATRFYKDEGVSGYGPWEERPGLRDLIRDAGRGKFDVVRVAAVTRLSRSRVDQADIIARVQQREA
ncbi:MAG: recombinase family protein [Chloroflexota bacterium]